MLLYKKLRQFCENESFSKTILACLARWVRFMRRKNMPKISWHCHFNGLGNRTSCIWRTEQFHCVRLALLSCRTNGIAQLPLKLTDSFWVAFTNSLQYYHFLACINFKKKFYFPINIYKKSISPNITYAWRVLLNCYLCKLCTVFF